MDLDIITFDLIFMWSSKILMEDGNEALIPI